MATKANIRANAQRKDLERRARRKLYRLKGKGVAVGSISPIGPVNEGDTRAVNRYNKGLKEFISRKTQYVAGFRGAPIPKKLWNEYQKLEKKWNKIHDKYWEAARTERLLGQDMTLLQKAAITGRKTLFGAADYQRRVPLEKVRGVKDLQRRMEILATETAPDYAVKRARRMREDMQTALAAYDSTVLTMAVKELTDEELVVLQNQSLFVEEFFTFDYNWTAEEYSDRIGALLSSIAMVKRHVR